MGPALLIAGAAGLTAIASISRGSAPSPRVFLGAAIAGGFVLALGQSQPQAASAFAGVVFTTALLTSGYDVASGVTRALNERSTPT